MPYEDLLLAVFRIARKTCRADRKRGCLLFWDGFFETANSLAKD